MSSLESNIEHEPKESTFVVVPPKMEMAENIDGFCPIRFTGSIYKILAKNNIKIQED